MTTEIPPPNVAPIDKNGSWTVPWYNLLRKVIGFFFDDGTGLYSSETGNPPLVLFESVASPNTWVEISNADNTGFSHDKTATCPRISANCSDPITTDLVLSGKPGAGAVTIDLQDINDNALSLYSNNDSGSGIYLDIYQNKPTPGAQTIGGVDFLGNTTSTNFFSYGNIIAFVTDATGGSEDSEIDFQWRSAGSAVALDFTGHTIIPEISDNIALGDGTHRFSDLFLAAGGVVDFSGVRFTCNNGEFLDSFFPQKAYLELGDPGTDYPIFQIESTNSGSGGPFIITHHNSASPAANDEVGGWSMYGNNSDGNEMQYGVFSAKIIDATAGSEDSFIQLKVLSAGSQITPFKIGPGLQIGSPTGGDKGAGTANFAGDIYKNNTAYTNPDYALEHWANGSIEQFRDNGGASEYKGRIPLVRLEDHLRRSLRLPGIGDEPMGAFARADILLEKLEEAYTYIIDLHNRVAELEKRNGLI